MSSVELNKIKEDLIKRNFLEPNFEYKGCLKDYDVIGFDVDYTLSLYRKENMAHMLYDTFTKYLIEKRGYPQHICYDNHKDFITKASTIDVVFDVEKGNALKLNYKNKVLVGYHGKKKLSEQDINSIYKDGIFSEFDIKDSRNDKTFLLKDYFVHHLVPLYMILVDSFDKGMLGNVKNYKQIKDDLSESITANFKLPDEFMDFRKIGYYFPAISKDPKKYLYTENAYMDMLKSLKKKGKFLFFATNSFQTYAEFILSNTVGENYLDIFDLGIFNAGKPRGFAEVEKKEDLDRLGIRCILQDKTQIDLLKPLSPSLFIRLSSEKIVHGFSYKLVEDFFTKLREKNMKNNNADNNNKKLKFLFIGDDLLGDCIAPSKLESWGTVNIDDKFLGNNTRLGEIWYVKEEEGEGSLNTKYYKENCVALLPNLNFIPELF